MDRWSNNSYEAYDNKLQDAIAKLREERAILAAEYRRIDAALKNVKARLRNLEVIDTSFEFDVDVPDNYNWFSDESVSDADADRLYSEWADFARLSDDYNEMVDALIDLNRTLNHLQKLDVDDFI